MENGEFFVLIIGNGDDDSHVNYCKHPQSNNYFPCELLGKPLCTPASINDDPRGGKTDCGSLQTSIDFHKNQFKKFKANTRFYAAVSPKETSSCRKYPARKGERYMDLAKDSGGEVFNICDTSISYILDKISYHLQAERVDLKTRYLFVDREPAKDPVTGKYRVKVTRYIGGDSNRAVVIPEDGTNGWTYEGQVSDVSVVYNPKNDSTLSTGSGYALRLHGSAELAGMDRSSVEFEDASAKPSVSE
jgi:hypothetical protein